VTNYSDSNLSPGATFYYRVRAANSAGNSPYTTPIAATTTLPRINQSVLANGLVEFSGSGGAPNQIYYLLSSTNLTLPLNQWTRVATNRFDAGGQFSFTNSVGAEAFANFYLLQLP
jgi:hypothetical protein